MGLSTTELDVSTELVVRTSDDEMLGEGDSTDAELVGKTSTDDELEAGVSTEDVGMET